MSSGAWYVLRKMQMWHEYDLIQQEEKAVHHAAWKEHEQLQVWYHREAGEFAAEKAEIFVQRANIESYATSRALQRDFDNQAVADAIEQRCRIQYEEMLAHAHSQAEVSLHACQSYKL